MHLPRVAGNEAFPLRRRSAGFPRLSDGFPDQRRSPDPRRTCSGRVRSASRDADHLLRRLPQHAAQRSVVSRWTALNLQTPADDAQTWEKALRKLRGHLMPPPGSPQPPQKDVDSFVSWMETNLDTHAKGPKAGYVPIERLNRTEYAASVKALVGVDVKEKDVLPQDIQVDGFDNIAAALSVSPVVPRSVHLLPRDRLRSSRSAIPILAFRT